MSNPVTLPAVLAIPPFRRLLVARTTSNLGNGMHPLALSFGVLALPDGSATALSLLLAPQALALIALLQLGGAVADQVGSAQVVGATEILPSGSGALAASVPLALLAAAFRA